MATEKALPERGSAHTTSRKIGKTTYIVTPVFKKNTDITVINKITRLIKTETEKLPK